MGTARRCASCGTPTSSASPSSPLWTRRAPTLARTRRTLARSALFRVLRVQDSSGSGLGRLAPTWTVAIRTSPPCKGVSILQTLHLPAWPLALCCAGANRLRGAPVPDQFSGHNSPSCSTASCTGMLGHRLVKPPGATQPGAVLCVCAGLSRRRPGTGVLTRLPPARPLAGGRRLGLLGPHVLTCALVRRGRPSR